MGDFFRGLQDAYVQVCVGVDTDWSCGGSVLGIRLFADRSVRATFVRARAFGDAQEFAGFRGRGEDLLFVAGSYVALVSFCKIKSADIYVRAFRFWDLLDSFSAFWISSWPLFSLALIFS